MGTHRASRWKLLTLFLLLAPALLAGFSPAAFAQGETRGTLTDVFYIPTGGNCAATQCSSGTKRMCRDSATSTTIYACNTSSGVYVAVASGGGGTPGGANKQVQLNSNGSFAGDTGLSFDPASDVLSVGAAVALAGQSTLSGTALARNGSDVLSSFTGLGGTFDFLDLKADLTLPDPSAAPTLGTTFSSLGSCRSDTTYRFTVVLWNASGGTAIGPTLDWTPSSGNSNRATIIRPSLPAGALAWSLLYAKSTDNPAFSVYRYWAAGTPPIDPPATSQQIVSCGGSPSTYTNLNTTGSIAVQSFFDGQFRGPRKLGSDADDPRLTTDQYRLLFTGTAPTWTPDAGVTTLPLALISGQTRSVCQVGCAHTTIDAAMASITDASPNKPYVVRVEAGNWPTSTLKDYVTLMGRGAATRIASLNFPAAYHVIAVMNTWITDGSVLVGNVSVNSIDNAQVYLIGNILGDPDTYQATAPIDTIWFGPDGATGKKMQIWDVANVHKGTWDLTTCYPNTTIFTAGSSYFSSNGADALSKPHSAWRLFPGCRLYASNVDVLLDEHLATAQDNQYYTAAITFQSTNTAVAQTTEIVVRNSSIVIRNTNPAYTGFAGFLNVEVNNGIPSSSGGLIDFSGSTLNVTTDPGATTARMGWVNIGDGSDADWAGYTFRWLNGGITLAGGAIKNLVRVATGSPAGMSFEAGPGIAGSSSSSIVGSATLTYPDRAQGSLRLLETAANGINYQELKAPTSLAADRSHTLNIVDATCTGDPNGGKLTVAGGEIVCAGDAGGAGTAFSSIAAGTNAQALVIGTNGSLTTSGTGTITANAVAANSVALTTGTTGNYVSSATGGGALTVTGTEGASVGITLCAANEIQKMNAGGTAYACSADSTGGAPAFNALSAGTNTTAAMIVGTGASLTTSGSGTIAATLASNVNCSNCIDLQTETTGTLLASSVGNGLTDTQVSDTLTCSNVIQGGAGSSPNLTSVGQVGIDTDANQLLWYSGGAVQTSSGIHEVCVMVPDLSVNDDSFEFWMPPYPVTVTAAGCHCRGTCLATLPVFQFTDRGGTAMTGAPTCSTGSSNTTFTGLSGGATALVEGEGLRFNVNPAGGTIGTEGADEYTICVKYTIDRQ